MCLAYAQNKIRNYPVKQGKQKVRERYFYYFDIRSKGKMLLKKRTAKDVWQNLYELPLIEATQKLAIDDLQKLEAFKNLLSDNAYIEQSITIKHVLSHQIIHTTFYKVEVDSLPEKADYIVIDEADVDNYPVSRLVNKYLSE